MLGKQRLSRNIASVRRYNDREVGHLFREFYPPLLTVFLLRAVKRGGFIIHTVILFDF